MESRNLLTHKVKIITIVLCAVVFRFVPHPPNVTLVGGLSLYMGSQFGLGAGAAIVFFAMVLSDIFLGFHSAMFFVYASYFLYVGLGTLLSDKPGKTSSVFTSTIGSVLFYGITNFGVWLFFDMYPKSVAGLINAYTMGIPFFKNTLLSDITTTLVFFFLFDPLFNTTMLFGKKIKNHYTLFLKRRYTM